MALKVIVLDSASKFIADEYRAMLPQGITVRGYDSTNEERVHPHGYQVGYYATHLLNLVPGEHELVFIRIFDGNARPIAGSNEFALDILEQECKPNKDGKWPVICNSWGADDGDIPGMERRLGGHWERWARKFQEITKSAAVFSAAGNDDHNDADNDVSYPWRILTGSAIIVGSHDRAGVPSVFSGDGSGVFLSMWGQAIPLLDHQGIWSVGSGTSFAAPKAAGLCAYMGMDGLNFRDYVRSHATKPDRYSGYLPHLKWGWGSMEYRYQELSSDVADDNKRPPVIRKSMMSLMQWRDFKKL
jgi:hypothetical protein